MCKIFIDFDGVLVDTPKYIKEEIELNGNCNSTFVNIKWNELLGKCNEIYNNIRYLKGILNQVEIIILTHVYSENEKIEKEKFIQEYIGNIKIIAAPYNIEKCNYVNAEKNLLIDDYKINVDNWNDKGGIGILFEKNMKLEDILKEYLELA